MSRSRPQLLGEPQPVSAPHYITINTAPATVKFNLDQYLVEKGLTSQQITQFKALRLNNGIPIVDETKQNNLVELISMIMSLGFEPTYAFLQANLDVTSVEELIFLNPKLDKSRNEIQYHRETIQIELKIRGGPKCINRDCTESRAEEPNTNAFVKQIRSLDEGATVFYSCNVCSTKWTG